MLEHFNESRGVRVLKHRDRGERPDKPRSTRVFKADPDGKAFGSVLRHAACSASATAIGLPLVCFVCSAELVAVPRSRGGGDFRFSRSIAGWKVRQAARMAFRINGVEMGSSPTQAIDIDIAALGVAPCRAAPVDGEAFPGLAGVSDGRKGRSERGGRHCRLRGDVPGALCGEGVSAPAR